MNNPYESPILVANTNQALPKQFRITRGVAIGVAVTGAALASLSVFLPMTRGLTARNEILGGMLMLVSGALLIFAYRKRHIQADVPARTGYSFAATLLIVGFLIAGKGYRTEQLNVRRFSDMKSNMKMLQDAVDRTQKSSVVPASGAEEVNH